jgi:hypothetical protein
MCGIAGVISQDKRVPFDKFTQVMSLTLLFELQKRGEHAWGVYLEKKGKENNKLYCGKEDNKMTGELFKSKNSVSTFFETTKSKIYLKNTHTMLMHTRATTSGSPENNENNHPFSTDSYILAHNGVIRNDDEIYKNFNIEHKGIECDSYSIISLIQHFHNEGFETSKAIEKASEHINGSYACWLYDKETNDVYLFRKSNPIEYYFDEERKLFVFASIDDYVVDAYNIDEVSTTDLSVLEKEKIFLLKKDELEEVGELKTPKSTTTTSSGRYYSGYSEHQYNYSNRFNKETNDTESKINKSLKELYYLFRKFEKKPPKEAETIIGMMNGRVVILVEPDDLRDLLDESGFEKYKQKGKVYGSRYYMYEISPILNIVKLTSVLMNESIGELTSKDRRHQLKELAETIDCEFCIFDNQYRFKYIKSSSVPEWIKKALSKRGLNFRKDNTIRLDINQIHEKKLDNVLKDLKLKRDEYICLAN